jgi:prepilin-type N-terminal cleavage/methylation domain-containing protein
MQSRNRAFTLIELLVVIAIIAILAAILFPVFAQAKQAAKATGDLSNIKQITLSEIMYAGDYDDRFTYAIPDSWSGAVSWGSPSLSWSLSLQPYVKSINLFRSPLETSTAIGSWGSWLGLAMSYGLNSFTIPNNVAAANYVGFAPDTYEGRCLKPTYTNTQDCTLRGIGAPGAQVYGENNRMTPPGGELNVGALTQTEITKPAESIMIATKFNGDALKWSGGGVGNMSQFECGGYFEGIPTTDGSAVDDLGWCGGAQLPNGLRAVDSNTPQGKYGAVGQVKQGKSNFGLSDGHAKNLDISSTNPDPDNNPLKNMWDCLRP